MSLSDAITVQGHIDDQHQLVVELPRSLPPGPVTVSITASQEDDAERHWLNGVSRQWADELGDTRQDIYSLSDGVPLDPS